MVTAVPRGSIFRDFRSGDGTYRTANESSTGAAGNQGSRPRADGTTGERASFPGGAGDQGRRSDESDGEQTDFQVIFHIRWVRILFGFYWGAALSFPMND